VLSRLGFELAMDSHAVAFWRCFGAFALLTLLIVASPARRARTVALRPDLPPIALCSFLGVFTLYHFETMAFALAPVPIVAMLVFAGGVVTILLSVVVLKESMNAVKGFGIAMVFVGAFLILMGHDLPLEADFRGVIFALIAGTGYWLFIFFWKYFRLPSGLEPLWWFFLFGTLYLAVPFLIESRVIPDSGALLVLAALVLLPSFGGFFCTTLAVRLVDAHRVQVIETSEPLFSAFFAFLLFGEMLSGLGMVGAAAIIGGMLTVAAGDRGAPA
jgi:drug/metabolite transporter (DMT)-like permease